MGRITFYLARADNGVIGDRGAIPWRIPGEQRRFKHMTMGKPMVMGRKTFESFSAPLPGRRHIVLTRDPRWSATGAEVARSVADAIALAGDVPEIAVIGGAEIFALFEPRADAVMPSFDPAAWREVSREDRPADGEAPPYSFVRLERI